MDSEKQAIPSTSKMVIKPTKTSREGSVCSDKSLQQSTKNSGRGKTVKAANKNPEKKITFVSRPAVLDQPNKQLVKEVSKLHDRTKRVRAKLSSMQKSKFPPKSEMPPKVNNHSKEETPLPSKPIKSTSDTPPNTPMDGLLSEQDILREIERLQELMKKVQLQNQNKLSATSESKVKEKDKTNRRLSKSDEVESKANCEGDQVEEKAEANPKRRRERTKKKKKKITNEQQLQELYVSHINQIINKDAEVKDPKNPQFKNGDDLEEFAAKCVEAGLGRIVEAQLRVNAKNNHQSFITVDNGSDAMIVSMAARKYAMDGDVVRAFIRNKNEEIRESVGDLDESIPIFEDPNETIDDPEDVLVEDVEILKKSEESTLSLRDRAFVIRIVKESGNRQFVGSIAFKNPVKHDDGEYFKFKTRDTKAPIMCIPVESCEEFLKQFETSSDDILGYLFVAQILKIEENGRCLGKLVAPVGKCGHLESEIKAILMHNRLSDVEKFEQRFEDMWAEPVKIEESDLENREDLRSDCIFTIDPLTARDLDDAVSCKKLDNERYEIGVHISDVTHYLEECCELDELVKLRATSIYLVNEVIHMLPQTLCMKCSLLPDEDKFTFSVFWTMDKDANVISTRFTRSVIRSCTQLAYEHAQKIIDNPNEKFNDNDFPTICNGFSSIDIVERVKTLNSLAETMRTRRFANGSLSIDKPQFYFQFDPKTGEPTSYEIANRLTANFLIEEFMLLANQSVADLIYKSFPDIAFLRSHQPPKASAIKSLKVKLNAMGLELDMSTSKSIYDGLKKICGSSCDPEVVSVAMNYLLTKPMMRAKYFCSENVDGDIDLRHYALAIPIYTHFTSPIRRYPDILVHRLLSAAMNYTPKPKRTHEELHELARICNDQKFNAKNASEESSNLYFKRYIKEKKNINVRAVVVDIYKHSIEVITLDTGHLIYVPFKLQKVIVDCSKAPSVIYISEKNSTKPPIPLKMFSAVDIRLTVFEGKVTGFFVSPEPELRIKNEIASCKAKSDRKKQDLAESSPGSPDLNSKQKRNERRKREWMRSRKSKNTNGATDE
ncbi:DIS3-like exonuclease 2 [Episyrphus balteatus]|uniref:DIS3-like exonuclease 2 n=1 Tax=Episyrphus balteatus TaxID=286459 RepID=UPI002486AF6D|nr:DIS3-like exonuclease 2 [Episyrphus balteatus]